MSHTWKLVSLSLLLTLSPYGAGCGCASNSAQNSMDMGNDMATGLHVTPSRISMSQGGTVQVTAAAAFAGQAVQILQDFVTVPLGVLDAQGQLQKALAPSDLTALKLGPAQIMAEGMQATMRFYLEPSLSTARPIILGMGSSAPVWAGLSQKEIFLLYYQDITMGMGLIAQGIGEYVFNDANKTIEFAPLPHYRGYKDYIFPDNIKNIYISTGVEILPKGLILAAYSGMYQSALIEHCLYNLGCNAVNIITRPYSRITSMTSDPKGALFAAIITNAGQPSALLAFSDEDLVTSVKVTGGNTALDAGTMLGIGLLDEDMVVDLLALTVTGTVQAWRGNQGQLTVSDALTMTLQQALSKAQIAKPTALAIGDIDGDGLDDIAVASDAQIVTLMNQGGGQFNAATAAVAPTGLLPVTAMAIGDVSVRGKGIPDLVVASTASHSVGVIENSSTY